MNTNMKRALILFVGLSMAASGAFAQERPARDRLEEIEQLTVTPFRHHKPAGEFDKVGINVIPEIGIGTSIVSSDDFKSRGSGVLYIHLLDAYVRPVSWVSLHVGGGIGWRKYQSKENVFSLNTNDKITIGKMPEEWAASGKSRSSIWGPSLLIPATLQFHFGDASLHLGAEALYSYRTRVRTDEIRRHRPLELRFLRLHLVRRPGPLRQVPAHHGPPVPRTRPHPLHLDPRHLHGHVIQIFGTFAKYAKVQGTEYLRNHRVHPGGVCDDYLVCAGWAVCEGRGRQLEL